MNRLFLIIITLLSAIVSLSAQETMEQDMFESMKDNDKAVVVAVHKDGESGIGSEGIERFNQLLRNAYPDYAFREACTTQGAMGQIPDPDELFIQLGKDGYTHVLVQPSNITNDLDMQYLRYIVEAAKGKFKHLRLGEPLLSDLTDYEKMSDIAISMFSKPKQMNVLVCNGEEDAAYMMLEYTLRDKSNGDWLLATTNGIPTLDHLIKMLRIEKNKKVLHLVPFNAETSKTTSSVWMKKLQQAGYKVTNDPHTLVEQADVINLFEQHIRQAEKHRRLTPKEQKIISR